MAKKSEPVTVHMDRPFTYELDTARRRTLPSGWRGEVDGDLAKSIEKQRKGRIVARPKPTETPKPKPVDTSKPKPGDQKGGEDQPQTPAAGSHGGGEDAAATGAAAATDQQPSE